MSIYIRSTAIMLLAILPLCAKEASSQSSQKVNDFMILLRDFTGKVSPENEKNVPQSFFIKKNEKGSKNESLRKPVASIIFRGHKKMHGSGARII